MRYRSECAALPRRALIALGFEFVNGFHRTANAVATVIYTHALPAEFAVIWSGFFNFLGVALSTGAMGAFGIISLLPVELILQVGSCRLRRRPVSGKCIRPARSVGRAQLKHADAH
jgi:phosphate/sulfate permease